MLSNWRNLVARRDLLRALVMSDLKASDARTRLGWLWWVLDPLLLMLIYWSVFSILSSRTEGEYAPYPIFILCALLPWKHLSVAAGRSASILRAQESLIRSVAFPTMVLPLSIVVISLIYFLFGFAILLVVAAAWENPNHSGNWWTVAQSPALMVLQSAVVTGVSLTLATLGVLIRDFSALMPHLFRVGFYLSPGLYGADMVRSAMSSRFGAAGGFWFDVYMLNPFAMLFTAYRDSIFYGDVVSARAWLLMSMTAILVLVAGSGIYLYFDRRLVKML